MRSWLKVENERKIEAVYKKGPRKNLRVDTHLFE